MFSWVKTLVYYSKERRKNKLSEKRRKFKVYINQVAWLPYEQ